MSIVYAASALTDLDAIEDNLIRRGAHVARLFQKRLAKALALHEQFPLSAPEYPTTDPRLAGLRYFAVRRFTSHAVFYQPTDDGIRVVRVLHTARNIAAILAPDPDPPTPPGS